jgi:hypothetical protein
MDRFTSGRQVDRQGFALATTLLIIMLLTVIAVGATWLASSEKKTSYAEGVHISSVFSADAGGEAAINFLRLSDEPPPIINTADLTVRDQGETAIQGSQSYDYQCQFMSKRPKPGWGIEFLDYEYRVTSRGQAHRKGQSAIQLVAARLFREGY